MCDKKEEEGFEIEEPGDTAGTDIISSDSLSFLSHLEVHQLNSEALPLSSMTRAERLLEKDIELTYDGSGAIFTREDIEKIHDSDVLQFLSRNARIFSRQRRPQTATIAISPPLSDEDIDAYTRPEDVETQMRNLQYEIETFITAVDEKGRKYHIVTDQQGKLIVPLEQNSDFEDEAGDTGDEESESKVATPRTKESVTIGSSSNSNRSSTFTSKGVPPHEGFARPQGDHTTAAEPMLIYPENNLFQNIAGPRSLHNDNEKSKQALGQVSVAATRTDSVTLSPIPSSHRKRRCTEDKCSLRSPLVKKRLMRRRGPVRDLQACEEARLEALLKEDFTLALSETHDKVSSGNPFNFSAVTAARLSEIDNSLKLFGKLHGPLTSNRCAPIPGFDLFATSHEPKEEDCVCPSPFIFSEQENHPTQWNASELGNAYMRTTMQQQQLHRRLRDVSTLLVRHRRDMERLPKTSDVQQSVPDEVQALRPEWARDLDVTLPEETVQEMIVEAQKEAEQAVQAGLTVPETCEPPLPYFQQHLKDVRERALCVLKDIQRDPLFGLSGVVWEE